MHNVQGLSAYFRLAVLNVMNLWAYFWGLAIKIHAIVAGNDCKGEIGVGAIQS